MAKVKPQIHLIIPTKDSLQQKMNILHNHAISYAKEEYSNNPLGLMARVLTKGELRDSLYMGLTYMRWLDYIADDSNMQHDEKVKLLQGNLKFLDYCKSKEFTYLKLMLLRIEERCAYYFIKDCSKSLRERSAPKKAIDEIIDSYILMIKSILQDTENQNKIMPEKEFYDKVYFLKAGVGIREYAYASTNSPSERLKRSFQYIGYIWQRTNDNMDIADDLKSGIINITKEELEKHKIDLKKYSGRYDELVDYLANETTFFEDRAMLLQKWKKIAEAGYPDMSFRQKMFVRRYLSLLCPKKFKPGTKHYRTMQLLARYKNKKKTMGLLMLMIFLVSRNLVLYTMEAYHRLKG
jgi:hypothetical protein